MKGKTLKVKTTATLMAILFLASITAIIVPVRATTWDVYDSQSIQAAINGASDWDTIIVHTGTYDGFKADKTGITVEAAAGETPVISGTMATGSPWGGQVVGVLVTADDVTIKGFKITGTYSTGIWVVSGADRVQILENTVDQKGFDPGGLSGVTWDGSAIQSHGDDTVIRNNRVKFGYSSRPHNGINVFYNDYTISKNTVTIFEMVKYQVGINVRGTATVAHNRVVCPDKTVGTWTRVFGIWFSDSTSKRSIERNQVSKTDYAVWLHARGIVPYGTPIDVLENTLVNNGIGIILEGYPTGTYPPSGVTINGNRIKNSWWADILYNY